MTLNTRRLKVIIAIFMVFSSIFVSINIYLNRMRFVKIPQDDENLGIKEEVMPEDKKSERGETEKGDIKKYEEGETQKGETLKDNAGGVQNKNQIDGRVINIALFGGDRRYKNDASHTDSVIVLSIDAVHKKVKISSIMRDTYVRVHGHGSTKLAHAYAYGGPSLAIRTLNENFSLGIRDYVFIDFYGFEKLVDLLGGVEVDISKNEIAEINKYIREVADIRKVRPKLIRKSGVQTLNGQQALAYSRIRKVGNGDFERTDRQRRVLSVIIKKLEGVNTLELSTIVGTMLSYVETSMSKSEILKMGFYILTWDVRDIEEQRFPMDGYYRGKFIDDVWYLVANLEATKRHMHRFIYEDKTSGSTQEL